jgi:hypothetical protein
MTNDGDLLSTLSHWSIVDEDRFQDFIDSTTSNETVRMAYPGTDLRLLFSDMSPAIICEPHLTLISQTTVKALGRMARAGGWNLDSETWPVGSLIICTGITALLAERLLTDVNFKDQSVRVPQCE